MSGYKSTSFDNALLQLIFDNVVAAHGRPDRRNDMNFRRLGLALAVILAPVAAQAQSYLPFFAQYNYVPTPAQWIQAWQAKQDVLGYTPCNTAGCSITGELWTAASTATQAGLNIGTGTAPTAPMNGDIWMTTAGLFAQVNSVTTGPFIANLYGALPSATSTQLYVGSGAPGAAGVLSTTGSGLGVLANSPSLVTPNLGTPASGALTNTSGYLTDNLVTNTSGANASAGGIGEIISSSIVVGSAVSQPTSGTAVNITSVPLTAGDWDCGGSVITNPGGTTTTSFFKGSMSLTGATMTTPPAGGYASNNGVSASAGNFQSLTLGRAQFNSSSPQTVYLVGVSTFGTSTMSLYGQINCRRVR